MITSQSVVVFGKDGQLGKAFQNILSQYPNVVFIGRQECDLTMSDQIQEVLEKFRPQIIINAAAYTAVDKAEEEFDLSFQINSFAPKIMAEYISQVIDGKFIHYSTDYVFDGIKQTPYLENDTPNPLGKYGESKLLGENFIKEVFEKNANQSSKYFILRTSWVYGDGANFIKTILNLAQKRDLLKVIHDQYGTPTSTEWLAKITLELIGGNPSSGIYNTVVDGETSWYGLAELAIEFAKFNGLNEIGDNLKVIPIPAVEYPLPAARPNNSRLNNNKLKQVLQIKVFPEWKEQVRDYVKKLVTK